MSLDNLVVAVPVFLASAAVVVIAGIALARFGDAIADQTGWGALWVGTILVSIATSLPELVTNISAVAIDSPGLALGNVFGANMVNMFALSMLALLFGVGRLFGGHSRQTAVLAVAAVGLGAVVLVIMVLGDVALGTASVGGLVIVAAYVGAMRLVYAARGSEDVGEEGDDSGGTTLRRAVIGFAVASLAIFAAAPFLAASADGIAEASGLSASFVGVLMVSIVTTLPEATVSVAATLRNSPGLVMGNLYGSCAFNLFVIPIADLFNGQALLNTAGPEHLAALGSAIALMGMAALVLLALRRTSRSLARVLVPAIAVGYPAAMLWVFALS